MVEVEFSDRYSATGIPYPDPETMCHGQCEGMGVVPVESGDVTEPWASLWNAAHQKDCNFRGILRSLWRHKEWWYWRSVLRDVWGARCWELCANGWHFVTCPTCHGTRLHDG